MSRTNIEWADYTWNPVTGCLHNCDYCYARKLAEGRLRGRCGYPADDPFRPIFHKSRLNEPANIKKPSKIFVCSMGDLFGEWVIVPWIMTILAIAEENPRHTFLFLTKNPKRYAEFDFPQNCWLGATITKYDSLAYHKIIVDMGRIPARNMNYRFISYEPMMGSLRPNKEFIEDLFFNSIHWIILGAMTGSVAKKYPQPDPKWIEEVIEIFRVRGRPIFMKDSIKPHWPGGLIREWPK